MKYKVIFICTGNSCRSQIAEGLLKKKAGNRFNVYSAGIILLGFIQSVSVMEEWGIDISHQKSEHLDEYVNREIDIVITVCDNAKRSCPVFSDGELKTSVSKTHFMDGIMIKELQPYRNTRDDLKNRIDNFCPQIC